MSVTASIIVQSKADVLTVPSGAVKTQNNTSYVQVLANGVPEKKTVVVGIADDTNTEIINGINEGDEVVTQTISSSSGSATKTSATSNSTNRASSFGGFVGGPMGGRD